MYDHRFIQSSCDRESGSHIPNRNGLNRKNKKIKRKEDKKRRWNPQIEFWGHFSPVKRDFIEDLLNFRLIQSDFGDGDM